MHEIGEQRLLVLYLAIMLSDLVHSQIAVHTAEPRPAHLSAKIAVLHELSSFVISAVYQIKEEACV